ncbi:MAG: glycosyltransferase family 4 protein [Patescibacteria group bacterium]|nr:glycosyltransferase family 4 protein [Patescibacteria group bacterium]MDE2438440.1 glycosyltransferase family 4 protein [Patescibacteria group bacterium]
MNRERTINVVVDQSVIPHYRIPFFQKLSEKVNLIVLANEDISGHGIKDIQENLPFRTLRLKEEVPGSGVHIGLFDIFQKECTDVYVTNGALLSTLLFKSVSYKKMRDAGVGIVWMGCDGYRVRNFGYEKMRRLFPWNIKDTYRWFREWITAMRTDTFVTYSSHTALYLERVLGISPRRITVGYNAIDTEGLSRAYLELQAQGRVRKKNRIAYVGRLIPEKRVDLLFSAFARILHDYPDAELIVIGEGPEKRVLEEFAQNLSLQNNILFCGGIYSDQEMAHYLYEASLLVLPGLGGLALNTGMAMGLPIICAHGDGTEEDFVLSGQNGWRFDGTEEGLVRSLREAFSDSERREKMGKKSFHMIRDYYNLERMVEGYLRGIQIAFYAKEKRKSL